MNFLDIILIILILGFIITGIILLVIGTKEDDVFNGCCCLAGCLFISFCLTIPFIKMDAGSGSTIGTITSVDKNFFGTTAVFIKTSETAQEEYCIEDEEVAQIARDSIGKNVKFYYGERIGIFSTGRCDNAPVEKIEVISE